MKAIKKVYNGAFVFDFVAHLHVYRQSTAVVVTMIREKITTRQSVARAAAQMSHSDLKSHTNRDTSLIPGIVLLKSGTRTS